MEILLKDERKLVMEYGVKLSQEKLSPGTSGNVSIYNKEKGLVAISPSGMNYEDVTLEDVVVIDLEGNVIQSDKKPSSEWGLHTIFYKNKPEARAVVHTHSIYCTTFATLNMPLNAVHYVIADAGVSTIPCAPYALFGTNELAEITIKACGDSDAALLANHGSITCGTNIKSAFGLARNLEYIAEVQYRAMAIGNPSILNQSQIDEVKNKFKLYGQPKPNGEKSCY